MKERGRSSADIARRTALGEEYVRDILNMLRNGEDRLLEAVLNGKIPLTIAVRIFGVLGRTGSAGAHGSLRKQGHDPKDSDSFKQVLDQRRHFRSQLRNPSHQGWPAHDGRIAGSCLPS